MYLVAPFCLLVVFSFDVEGCHNAQHTQPTAALTFSGRKRREVSCPDCAEDVDEDLSSFFTDCMMSKRPGEFTSWRSVVDFVIRDSKWFQATDEEFCSGRKDSAKCWQRRTEYMLNFQSSLISPTKDCIAEYDRHVKDSYGAEFEQYYIKNFDMYDYEISIGEFMRPKRNLTDSDDGVNKFAGAVVDVANQIAQNCHLYDVLLYGECLVSKFEDILDAFLITHPSLTYYNQTVNDKFVKEHYSSCRISVAEVNGKTIYTEHCPLIATAEENPTNSFRHADVAPRNSCLISDYLQIVKPTSPVYSMYSSCASESRERLGFTTQEPAITRAIVTEKPEPLEIRKFGKKRRLGRCLAGSYWTKFYNLDSPEGLGDLETLESLRNAYRFAEICQHPVAVHARIAKGSSGDHVLMSLDDGLRCFNNMQSGKLCSDYEVRFCCREVVPECSDGYAWTPWLDRDRPKRGEDESLAKHLSDGNACDEPTNIRARIRNSKHWYWKGNNVLDISPSHGLTCKRRDQLKLIMCKNYEVSFCCPDLSNV